MARLPRKAILSGALSFCAALGACASQGEGHGAGPSVTTLAGTSWRLVELQSPDPAARPVRPDDPAKYEMTLGADGQASLRLDCNRAAGRWSASATDAVHGGFTFGPLAMTRAACLEGSLDVDVAHKLDTVRSYALEGDLIRLTGEAGASTWRRVSR